MKRHSKLQFDKMTPIEWSHLESSKHFGFNKSLNFEVDHTHGYQFPIKSDNNRQKNDDHYYNLYQTYNNLQSSTPKRRNYLVITVRFLLEPINVQHLKPTQKNPNPNQNQGDKQTHARIQPQSTDQNKPALKKTQKIKVHLNFGGGRLRIEVVGDRGHGAH